MKHFNPIIQVAGIGSSKEAKMIAEAGATHLGFPFRLDFHKEDISESEAKDIIQELPKNITPVLITYLDDADQIKVLMQETGFELVQLHGKISIAEMIKLRKISPGIEIWKSIVIYPGKKLAAFEVLEMYAPFADAFITDTFDPETGASGATGKTHDWRISREIVERSNKPVILAGGLNPDNVFDAIRATRPAGVDVHTGVENITGEKDQDLVERFIENSLKGFEPIHQG